MTSVYIPCGTIVSPPPVHWPVIPGVGFAVLSADEIAAGMARVFACSSAELERMGANARALADIHADAFVRRMGDVLDVGTRGDSVSPP